MSANDAHMLRQQLSVLRDDMQVEQVRWLLLDLADSLHDLATLLGSMDTLLTELITLEDKLCD